MFIREQRPIGKDRLHNLNVKPTITADNPNYILGIDVTTLTHMKHLNGLPFHGRFNKNFSIIP